MASLRRLLNVTSQLQGSLVQNPQQLQALAVRKGFYISTCSFLITV